MGKGAFGGGGVNTGVPDPGPFFGASTAQGASSIINANRDLGVSAGESTDLANNALRNQVGLSQAALQGAQAQASQLPGLINLINQTGSTQGANAGFQDAFNTTNPGSTGGLGAG